MILEPWKLWGQGLSIQNWYLLMMLCVPRAICFSFVQLCWFVLLFLFVCLFIGVCLFVFGFFLFSFSYNSSKRHWQYSCARQHILSGPGRYEKNYTKTHQNQNTKTPVALKYCKYLSPLRISTAVSQNFWI